MNKDPKYKDKVLEDDNLIEIVVLKDIKNLEKANPAISW